MVLNGKRLLLGITGGIAAYKAAHLVRLFIKAGAEVKVIMTTSALDFITPLTLSTLSKGPVYHKFFESETGEWHNHVALGAWADLFLIAPLTAATLSKMANGMSDDLLSCTYLSAKCPVMVAPAMDLDMYLHPTVTSNLKKLQSYGNIILEAETGELASGLVGQGRMMEPENILAEIQQFFKNTQSLKGFNIMITAGPTVEALDPVRFISNHSSGKMGIALAEEGAKRGASVHLILGPSRLKTDLDRIQTIDVVSAEDMYQAAATIHKKMDVSIFTAAVADYRPEKVATHKIKKEATTLSIPLVKNRDIAYSLGQQKSAEQIHIGFALESEEGTASAKEKLSKKNFDFIVLNSLQDKEAGFQKDTNKVKLFFKNKEQVETPVLSKNKIAALILDELETFLKTTRTE